MSVITTTIVVNGVPITKAAPGHFTLLRWLRDEASIFDPKYGCGEGVCGACTVLIDGVSAGSCVILAASADGTEVTTHSGLAVDGELSPLQEAFVEYGAAQCGFCTGGTLLAIEEAFSEGWLESRDDIREAIHGNLCRCTGYQSIVDAVASQLEPGSQPA